MTIEWLGGLDGAVLRSGGGGGPRYRVLAESIGRAVESGALEAGAQLPTHRAMAEALGVSIGTVTRAYAEAERQGLVRGEVGRGTFVRDGAAARPAGAGPATGSWGDTRAEDGWVDLSLALPWTLPGDEEGRLLSSTLSALAREPGLTELLQYRPESAPARHREGASRWLERWGVPAAPGRVVVTAGAQHAIAVLLMVVARPAEEVLVEALTYPGMVGAARSLGHGLRGVELDGEGMVPEALERASRESRARIVYVVPDAQNPTGVTMSEARRRAIVTVARALDLLIVEDGVHRPLAPDLPPSLAALAPERTIHLATLSKAVAFGLRTGFVAAPERYVAALAAGVRGTIWMPAPLMTEVALRWLADGTAQELSRRKRTELVARHTLLEDVLRGAGGRLSHDPAALHAWLELPEPWRAEELVERARRAGVVVTGAGTFVAGRAIPPRAVRIALGMPRDRATLRRGLEALAGVVASGPHGGHVV